MNTDIESLRQYFENYISESPSFRGNTPLGKMVINDKFHHYMNADTDNMWIGLAIGMRLANKILVNNIN